MATRRRLDRRTGRRSRQDLTADRRTQAVNGEILVELEQVNAGLAHLAARIEIIDLRCRAEDRP